MFIFNSGRTYKTLLFKYMTLKICKRRLFIKVLPSLNTEKQHLNSFKNEIVKCGKKSPGGSSKKVIFI